MYCPFPAERMEVPSSAALDDTRSTSSPPLSRSTSARLIWGARVLTPSPVAQSKIRILTGTVRPSWKALEPSARIGSRIPLVRYRGSHPPGPPTSDGGMVGGSRAVSGAQAAVSRRTAGRNRKRHRLDRMLSSPSRGSGGIQNQCGSRPLRAQGTNSSPQVKNLRSRSDLILFSVNCLHLTSWRLPMSKETTLPEIWYSTSGDPLSGRAGRQWGG